MIAKASHAHSLAAGDSQERGGIRFLRPAAAISVVQDAQQRGIAVLGLDAFFLTSDTTQPSLANSVIFTTEGNVRQDSHTRALAHLRGLSGQNLFFEVVLDEPPNPGA